MRPETAVLENESRRNDSRGELFENFMSARQEVLG
jgi:hypothetical protein